jgi:Bacteriocin-protection, YdeI or OmpD-Associated/Domain of unknown function (DUF1905)
MQLSYTALVQSDPPSLFMELPNDLVASLRAGKRPPMKVTINGVQTRTRIAVYGGRSFIGFSKRVREQMRIHAGQSVQMLLELDDEPRGVDLPDDLLSALARDPQARAAFDELSFTNRKEYADWITAAKRPETRQRRLQQAPSLLKSGRKTPL